MYSTIDGMGMVLQVEASAEWFRVAGAIDGSEEGEDELRVDVFSMTTVHLASLICYLKVVMSSARLC